VSEPTVRDRQSDILEEESPGLTPTESNGHVAEEYQLAEKSADSISHLSRLHWKRLRRSPSPKASWPSCVG
jgi:hypothetical protein